MTEATSSHWVHDLDPFIYQFSNGFGLRWYGLSYAVGLLAVSLLFSLYRIKGRSPLNENQERSFFTYIILGVIVGGRLGYALFYAPEMLTQEPLSILKIWEPGMSSHGGFIGVILAILYFRWRNSKVAMMQTADCMATIPALGFGLGRLANFINGELWGKISYVKWAVIFPNAFPPGVPRHPSQLYEACLEGFLLFAYMQWRFWKTEARMKPGQLSGEFLLGYACLRIIGELFREPDASLIWGIQRGVFFSIFLGLGGLICIASAQLRKPLPKPYANGAA